MTFMVARCCEQVTIQTEAWVALHEVSLSRASGWHDAPLCIIVVPHSASPVQAISIAVVPMAWVDTAECQTLVLYFGCCESLQWLTVIHWVPLQFLALIMHLFYSILLRHPNHTAWCLCLESHEVRDGCIFSHFLPLYNLYRDHIESERNSHCGSKQHKTSCGWWSGTQTSASHEFSCRGGLLDCLKLETAERHLKFHCKGSPHVKQWQNIRHLLPRIMLLYAYMAPAPATAPAAAPPTAYIAMFAFEFGGFATPEYP